MEGLLLNKIRVEAARYLSETCVIEQEIHTVGAYGDPIRAWALVASEVPCRLIIARRSDLSAVSMSAGRETMERVYRLVVPHGTTLDVDYRVTVGGAIFTVMRVEDQLTDAVFVQAILARRI